MSKTAATVKAPTNIIQKLVGTRGESGLIQSSGGHQLMSAEVPLNFCRCEISSCSNEGENGATKLLDRLPDKAA